MMSIKKKDWAEKLKVIDEQKEAQVNLKSFVEEQFARFEVLIKEQKNCEKETRHSNIIFVQAQLPTSQIKHNAFNKSTPSHSCH